MEKSLQDISKQKMLRKILYLQEESTRKQIFLWTILLVMEEIYIESLNNHLKPQLQYLYASQDFENSYFQNFHSAQSNK